jgi:hypothetical protein
MWSRNAGESACLLPGASPAPAVTGKQQVGRQRALSDSVPWEAQFSTAGPQAAVIEAGTAASIDSSERKPKKAETSAHAQLLPATVWSSMALWGANSVLIPATSSKPFDRISIRAWTWPCALTTCAGTGMCGPCPCQTPPRTRFSLGGVRRLTASAAGPRHYLPFPLAVCGNGTQLWPPA